MKGLQRSNRNLTMKDFFSGIDIKPVKTKDPNKRDVAVKVQEKARVTFHLAAVSARMTGLLVSSP